MAAGGVLCALIALLILVDYEPLHIVTDAVPKYLSKQRAADLETTFRNAGVPLRSGMQELIVTPIGRDEIYRKTKELEKAATAASALPAYYANARAGHPDSALRLAEIYDRGAPGVNRDYAESLQWYETARRLGADVPQICCQR